MLNVADGILLPEGMTQKEYFALSDSGKLDLIWFESHSDGKLSKYRGKEALHKLEKQSSESR